LITVVDWIFLYDECLISFSFNFCTVSESITGNTVCFLSLGLARFVHCIAIVVITDQVTEYLILLRDLIFVVLAVILGCKLCIPFEASGS
jgi:hypothetical protein